MLDDLNNLPVKVVNGATVYLRDVAQVRDGYAVQTSIVRTNGTRGALLTVMRNGQASTLAVVNNVKAALPRILAGLPPELQVRQLFDQSLFVRAAINGVVREAIIAAFLTGLMILLFLGSWRSTVIVCISIPLSILTSLIVLSLLGQTINVMTLGGLALAVGILVDDATVEIENTHRNMAMKKPLVRAVLDGAQQIAAPAFVSTLCHLHRVRAGAAADGRGQVPVHAAGHGGGFRHDGVLPALAHPDPHHGALPAEAGSEAVRPRRARRNGRRQGAHLEGALSLQPPLRADARILHVAAGLVRSITAGRCWPASAFSWPGRCAWPCSSAATSSPRWIPARCACTRARLPARASSRPR